MPVGRATFAGSPFLGVHLKVGENAAVVPPSTPGPLLHLLESLFHVPLVRTRLFDTEVVGSFVTFNTHGVAVGAYLRQSELDALKAVGPVHEVRGRFNALGNNVLANDRGAIVNPDLSDDAVAAIGRALEVPARRGTIAGLGTVGMVGIATNVGVVLHPKVTEHEARAIEEVLGVPAHRSTANFGVPVVGACLVANSKAILAGRPTTSVEISHLQEGLQVFD
ncbi:MAG: translation initiation factor IF-6 [Thermoplasmata archaeon]|nr:translation initiation factor IF-6 [Thermoplasmata archaeon]MCI4344506.1 translation initiation factor IF-6 [Thermoplasmata archaeon]